MSKKTETKTPKQRFIKINTRPQRIYGEADDDMDIETQKSLKVYSKSLVIDMDVPLCQKPPTVQLSCKRNRTEFETFDVTEICKFKSGDDKTNITCKIETFKQNKEIGTSRLPTDLVNLTSKKFEDTAVYIFTVCDTVQDIKYNSRWFLLQSKPLATPKTTPTKKTKTELPDSLPRIEIDNGGSPSKKIVLEKAPSTPEKDLSQQLNDTLNFNDSYESIMDAASSFPDYYLFQMKFDESFVSDLADFDVDKIKEDKKTEKKEEKKEKK